MLTLTDSRVTVWDSNRGFAICRWLLPTHMEVTDVFLTRFKSMHALAKVSLRLTTTPSKLTYSSHACLNSTGNHRAANPLSKALDDLPLRMQPARMLACFAGQSDTWTNIIHTYTLCVLYSTLQLVEFRGCWSVVNSRRVQIAWHDSVVQLHRHTVDTLEPRGKQPSELTVRGGPFAFHKAR